MGNLKEAKNKKFLYKELSYEIIGCFYEIYNKIGSGFKENIYQRALLIELDKRKILFERERKFPIYYEGKKIGIYQPDFVIDSKIIVEIKSLPFMPELFEDQLLNYLKVAKLKLGFLVNFGNNKIEIKRRILD